MDLHAEPAPIFYKLMRVDEDFTFKLEIPQFFVKKYGGIMPQIATLRTDQCGKTWRVGIEQNGEHCFFSVGWSKFANDVDLKFQEHLMFKFLGESEFSVTIYGMTGCKKELYYGNDYADEPRNFPVKVKCESEDNFIDQGGESSSGKRWRFVTELKRHHVERLGIPKDFAIGTGIAKNGNVKLLDAEGRKWPVCVTDRNIGKFGLTAGWHDFLIGKNVVVGSVIELEFISDSDNTIEARVFKLGAHENELFSSVKKRQAEKRKDKANDDDRADGLRNLPVKIESENGDDFTVQQGFYIDKSWRFSMELEKQHAHMLDIPEDFVTGTGIARNKKINLMDAEGRMWLVFVTERACGVFAMTTGWFEFLIGNKVVIGSTISFEFVPNSDNMVEARVLKAGINEKELFGSTAKRIKRKISQKIKCQNPKTGEENGSGFHGRQRFIKKIRKCDAYILYIPKDFAFNTRIVKNAQIELQDEKGRKWQVSIKCRNESFCMISGWNDFLLGNNVIIGSTISFELVSGSENIIEARVLEAGRNEKRLFNFVKRKPENRPMHTKRGHGRGILKKSKCENEENLTGQLDGSGVNKRWRFEKELKKHHAYVLDIPKDFAVRSGIAVCKKIKVQDAKGRIWHVYTKQRKCGVFSLTTGWFDFLKVNKVVIGSTISLEFIPGSENIIQVRVVKEGMNRKAVFNSGNRKSFPPDRTKNQAHEHGKFPIKIELERQEGDRVSEGQSICDLVWKWNFSMKMKKHHSRIVDIPTHFAVGTGISRNRKIQVQNVEGRKWPVSVIHRKCGMFALAAGWNEFLVGNKVTVGSMVSFEFMAGSNNVIEARVQANETVGERATYFCKSQKRKASYKPS